MDNFSDEPGCRAGDSENGVEKSQERLPAEAIVVNGKRADGRLGVLTSWRRAGRPRLYVKLPKIR